MVYRLSEEKKKTRKQEAIRLAKSGMCRKDIAAKLGASHVTIKRVLDDAGIPLLPRAYKNPTNPCKVHPMWDAQDPNVMRQRFAKRAASGARADR